MSKFKVGDRVEVILDYYAARVGDVGIIKEVANQRYGIEFERERDDFHDCLGATKDKHGHYVRESHLKLYEAPPTKIVITTDGKTTIATMYNDGKKVKTAEAKCHPDADFDFGIGAKLAVERLFAPEPRFKIGDKVIGNDIADEYYCITKKGWIGTVINIYAYGNLIEVRGFSDDLGHWVNVNAFDLYTEPEYFTGDVVCVKNTFYTRSFTVGKIYHFKDGRATSDKGHPITYEPVTSVEDLNAKLIYDTVKFIELVK